MTRALDSPIAFPSRSTREFWMLLLLMPEEVRRNFKTPPCRGKPSPARPQFVNRGVAARVTYIDL